VDAFGHRGPRQVRLKTMVTSLIPIWVLIMVPIILAGVWLLKSSRSN
jgi:hypothetical protein